MRIEDGAKRVRVVRDGVVVADTLRPKLVWEVPNYPMYWIPAVDARVDGVAKDLVRHGGEGAEASLAGYVRLDWEGMDHWFEEDEEIFVHPRDPYCRVDILGSSRHVVVRIGGVVVGESRQPRLLFETGLPTRYYPPGREPEDRRPGGLLQRPRRSHGGRLQSGLTLPTGGYEPCLTCSTAIGRWPTLSAPGSTA